MKLVPDEIFQAAMQFLRGGGANACLKPNYGEQYFNELTKIMKTYCASHGHGWLSTDNAQKCLHDSGWWPLSIQGSPRDQTERPMIETREEAIEHTRVNKLMETEEGRAALKTEYEKRFSSDPAVRPRWPFLDIEDTEFNKAWMKHLKWEAQTPEAKAAAVRWEQPHGVSREEALRKSKFITTEPGFTVMDYGKNK